MRGMATSLHSVIFPPPSAFVERHLHGHQIPQSDFWPTVTERAVRFGSVGDSLDSSGNGEGLGQAAFPGQC